MRNNVKALREEKNMSQEELARRCNLSKNTIGAIELNENCNPTYSTMRLISQALDRPLNEVFILD